MKMQSDCLIGLVNPRKQATMEYSAEVTDIATSDTYYIHILNIYN